MIKSVCLVMVAALVVSSCKVSQNTAAKDPVIATLGQTPVYSSEFKYVYDKNAVADSLGKEESLQQYLDLYLNFRLKVLEAESLGLDTAASFKQELSGYKQQLAEPYLLDSSVTESLVKEAYNRLKEEIRAKHILINLPQDADPKDTLATYQKLAEIRQKAISGEDFEVLAKASSQDPSAQMNGGDLGYFTALQMVYPFEDAAYKTKIGEISMPFRTKFGYHIVKVIDRRPSQGKVKTAHIMVRTNPEVSKEDFEAAKQKIDEIYRRLQQGGNWDQLTQQFSEDGASKGKGGVLPAFSTGNMIPSFEEAAFALKKPGDFSAPVLTPYGWHIIKLVEKAALEPFEELETSLRQKVSKDSRSELNRTLLLKRLKTENRLVENPKMIKIALSQATDSLPAGTWNYTPGKSSQKTLFTIQKKKYSLNDFYAFVKQNQQSKPAISPAYYMQLLYNDFVNQSMLTYEKTHLEEKYPDYKYLVREYRDGMLLFQRMEERIWSRSLTDSIGYKAYFDNNREKYQWDQRVIATVYNAANAETIAEVKKLLQQKTYPVSEPAFGEIYFERGKSDLSAAHKTKLDNLAKAIVKDKSLVLEIAGHGDLREEEAISGIRAKAVTDYLIAQGADITRIIIKDFGRFKPVSKTDRSKNSRVAIEVSSNAKSAIEKRLNANKPLNLEITEGAFQKGDNQFIDQVQWKPGNYLLEQNNRVIYIEIISVEAPRPKSFEEARGAVISDYQAYLEKEWIDDLKKKYPVVVFEKEVAKLLN